MRIATWNINGLNARLPFVEHWLAAREPDIVGLQELKMVDEKFPHLAFEAAGYKAVTHGQKSWNGVAVLSKEEVEVVERGLPGQEAFGSRYLHVKTGDLDFITVYCPNGKTLTHDDYPRKLAWYDTLAEHIANVLDPNRPAILCGDFNICPTALDTWNEEAHAGEIFHTDEERARLNSLIDWGFTDVYRALHPDTQAFSWWDYRGGAFHKKQGLRIDFVLATKPALDRVTSTEIDRDYRKKKDGLSASDHAPVMADLD